MTASRYQSAESGSRAGAASVLTSGEVIEASVRSPVYTEDMRGKLVRIQLDVVAPAGPLVLRAAEKVMDLVGFARRDVEPELDPARLGVLRIQVNYNQQHTILMMFAVTNHQIVVDGMELQAPVGLQRRVVAPDAVEPGDQLAVAVAARAVPLPDLVL